MGVKGGRRCGDVGMLIWHGIDGKERQRDSEPSKVLRTERYGSNQPNRPTESRDRRCHTLPRHCAREMIRLYVWLVLSGSNHAAKSRSKFRLDSVPNNVSLMFAGSKSPSPEPKSRLNAGSRLSFVTCAGGGGGGGGWFMADGPELIIADGDGAVIVDVFGVAGAGVPTGGGPVGPPCCGP